MLAEFYCNECKKLIKIKPLFGEDKEGHNFMPIHLVSKQGFIDYVANELDLVGTDDAESISENAHIRLVKLYHGDPDTEHYLGEYACWTDENK